MAELVSNKLDRSHETHVELPLGILNGQSLDKLELSPSWMNIGDSLSLICIQCEESYPKLVHSDQHRVGPTQRVHLPEPANLKKNNALSL